MIRPYTNLLMTLIISMLLHFPAPSYAVVTHDNDDFDIPEPAYDGEGDYVWSDGTYFTSIYQVRKLLDLNWVLQKIGVLSKDEAENINEWDEVPNSTWFTNRHADRRMSREELIRGPGPGVPPDGPWTVVKGKALGINPGFVGKDQMGRLFFVKFDPPDYPGMGTNADVIVSRFLHAAGYNVQEYFQIVVDPSRLTLSPEATIPGKYKVERRMTPEDLKGIFSSAPKNVNGRIFGGVSIGLQGKPKGPFNYLGVRRDDPNDTVRHENRRELRGLRIIMSWLNNTDSGRRNSIDMYVEKDHQKYLKHYLMDFSRSLGSANTIPKRKDQGHEYFFDPGIVSRSLGALGIWVKPWERPVLIQFPEIGFFEAETFVPEKWRASCANPAFEKMTARDAYWGTKIVTSFTDTDIRTIVDLGYFPTPGAKDYLAKTLIERRDRIGRYWFSVDRINPLDDFTVETLVNEKKVLVFRDLAVDRGYADSRMSTYRYRLNDEGYVRFEQEWILLPKTDSPRSIEIQTSRNRGESWGRSLSVYLRSDAGELYIARIQR